jgi:thymidylate kinase
MTKTNNRGCWTVLIGPDGVGKTSVAQGIFPKVADRFDSLRYHHWIAPWTQPLRSDVPPGGGRFEPGPCRCGFFGNLISLARLARNIVRAWLGYVLRIRPHLRRSRLVLGDRYLFNYLLDPQSVRYGAAPFWVRLALRLVPKPDVVISLVADPEVIHARKDELSVTEIADRLARARELRSLGFNLVEVSADAPLSAVIENAAAVILNSRA